MFKKPIGRIWFFLTIESIWQVRYVDIAKRSTYIFKSDEDVVSTLSTSYDFDSLTDKLKSNMPKILHTDFSIFVSCNQLQRTRSA